jgi:hypothetical protein
MLLLVLLLLLLLLLVLLPLVWVSLPTMMILPRIAGILSRGPTIMLW